MPAPLLRLILAGYGRSLLKVAVAALLLLLILVAVIVAVAGAAIQSAIASAPAGASPHGQPAGPVDRAGCATGVPVTIRTASIRDLCFGPSDAARLARLIAAIRPDSPLVARAGTILQLGQRFGIDPLLIVQWQGESQLATDGPPTSANGPDNGGNLTWAAAAPYAAAWGCVPGARVDYPGEGSYLFARCPSIEAGLGLWFAYVGGRYPPERFPDLASYAETYNACSYAGNRSQGFLCGEAYAGHILELLARHAGPPVAGRPPPGGDACGPLLPVVRAEANRALPPGVEELMLAIFGGQRFPVTYGWGISELEGEPAWLGHPHFHAGLDFGTPVGVPVLAPADGVATPTSGGGGLIIELRLRNGATWRFLHLSQQLADGPVRRGDLLARTGNSGYSSGPHLHLELREPSGAYIAPEHWACVGIPR